MPRVRTWDEIIWTLDFSLNWGKMITCLTVMFSSLEKTKNTGGISSHGDTSNGSTSRWQLPHLILVASTWHNWSFPLLWRRYGAECNGLESEIQVQQVVYWPLFWSQCNTIWICITCIIWMFIIYTIYRIGGYTIYTRSLPMYIYPCPWKSNIYWN